MDVVNVTRADLAEAVRLCRAEGWTYREIATELGISISHANDLTNDPDGSKAQARKDTYRGACIDCGGPTSGCNGRAKAPERCVPCHLAHVAAQHGTRSKYDGGCRCAPCTQANREGVRNWAATTTLPIVHGRPSSYGLRGCRCDACREAAMTYERERRADRLARGALTHGTATGYAYGCRCDECKAANAAKNREYRDRRKAAAS